MSEFKNPWKDFVALGNENGPSNTPKAGTGESDTSSEAPPVMSLAGRELARNQNLPLSPIPDTIPRLPWQLERLVGAASSELLTFVLPGVPNPSSYVMAWACSYLIGDRNEAMQRLWTAFRAWQGAGTEGRTKQCSKHVKGKGRMIRHAAKPTEAGG